MNQLHVRCYQTPWNASVAFQVRMETSTGRLATAEPIAITVREEGVKTDPTFELETKACQLLMDDLWQCGFRPSEGTGSAGAMAATQKHLEDMRKLVFSPESIK